LQRPIRSFPTIQSFTKSTAFYVPPRYRFSTTIPSSLTLSLSLSLRSAPACVLCFLALQSPYPHSLFNIFHRFLSLYIQVLVYVYIYIHTYVRCILGLPLSLWALGALFKIKKVSWVLVFRSVCYVFV
jgi:hypothetical protein